MTEEQRKQIRINIGGIEFTRSFDFTLNKIQIETEKQVRKELIEEIQEYIQNDLEWDVMTNTCNVQDIYNKLNELKKQ